MAFRIKDVKPGEMFSKLTERIAKHISGPLGTVTNFLENDERVKRIRASRGFKSICRVISDHWMLCFFVLLIIYLETVYRLWLFRELSSGYFFAVIFALSAGTAIYIIISAFPVKKAKIISIVAAFLITLIYGVQLIYYCIFRTPLSLISIGGAGDAMQFWDIAVEAILKNIVAVLLLFVPAVLLLLYRERITFRDRKPLELSLVLAFCVLSDPGTEDDGSYEDVDSPMPTDGMPDGTTEGQDDPAGPDNVPEAGTDIGQADPEEATEPMKPYNVMDIDFEALMASGQDDPLYPMHKYFSSVEPTPTNEYTGMFRGCNLIMFTAEGFSPYAVSPELTPTLYRMINEGFVFKNFYTPVWWVSTSDGEYVACTGLIPKGGVWSMARSGSNYMPFAMGNQLRNLGYLTKAYHNHTYTYYKRDVSHPNLGYDYKGVGNGLEVRKSWPESDLEMIEVTVDEYIDHQPFHAYYMTVSGHMNYNFYGNQMASKNREYVEHLPYSDASKAYIACNLELEFAMKALMDRLEAAGIAENTVIVLSADHYPYGLPKENIDELAGHEVEPNFELYKNHLIIYKKGMDPVIVDKPCESLDIIPTISNLFGLEYDSRLLMGEDILSSAPPLVIFSNRSWITDRAMYDSTKNKVTFTDGTEKDDEYVKKISRIVADKFKYSARILETDYYGKVLKPVKQQEVSGD